MITNSGARTGRVGRAHSSCFTGGYTVDKIRLSDIYCGLRERIESLGYDCVGFENVTEDEMKILRVYVDLPGGVNLSDCEAVAREVNVYLDEMETSLPERYYLEVSSPGLERPLFTPEDYKAFSGREAQVSLKSGKKIAGIINGVDDDGSVHFLFADGESSVPFADIKKGKLVYKEEKGQKKTFKKIKKK
ncbi:MAG TPA: ribosome assembly cofactor RimP [Synergistaceae bacterium]|nr:ribosome assembly cofactor RimP [Synergistaceae bacterium]